jgi:4-amino-4-deoxy-L-arabinose transferase-like glycosyltransferase
MTGTGRILLQDCRALLERLNRRPVVAPARLPLLAGAVTTLTALILYLRTLAPTVLVGDSGEFQFTGAILGVPHPTGYPLYTLLNKLFSFLPVGDVAYRVNLSSAVYAALACGLVTGIVYHLLGHPATAYWGNLRATPDSEAATVPPPLARAGVAVGAGLLLAAAGTLWAQALVARSYALNALLVALAVACLLAWRATGRTRWWAGFWLVLGLSFTHHGTTIVLVPGYGLFLLALEVTARRGEPWRPRLGRWALGLGAFALGLTPYLFLAYRFVRGYTYYWGEPQTWADVLYLARGTPFAGQIFAYPLTPDSQWERLVFGGDQIVAQFGSVGALLALWGLLRLLWRPRLRAVGGLLLLLLLGNFAFAVNYGIIGHIYLIPSYLFLAIAFGFGIADLGFWILDFGARLVHTSKIQNLKSKIAPVLGVGLIVVALGLMAARLPAQDRSGDTAVRDAALTFLAAATPNARVYVDWEAICVLRYYQFVEHRRPDLTLLSGNPDLWDQDLAADLAAGHPVYVGNFAGPMPPQAVRDRFALTPVGLVYAVAPK